MLLISWNVAGLNTTLARIDKDFKSASLATTPEISANKRTRSHAFSYYLKRHGDPDILCIQEHKIPLKQLSSRSEPFGCSSLEGYDSFWACCVDKSKRGFNGVCTYAKSSTVQFANSRPLGCDDLDDQGRVIMTDHKYFVVFNVYAPASCGMPLSYKMRFLNALQRAMAKQRSEGKKVFLVGDLNITFSGLDIHWISRTVKVNDIIRENTCHQNSKEDQKQSNSIPKWKVQVAQHWDAIQCALDTIEAIPVTTKNIATGNSFEKFRARVIVGKSGSERKVLLGGHEASADDCLRSFIFEEKNYLDHDLQQTILAREPNVIPLHILAELMSKIAKVDWDSPTLRLIAGTAGLMKSSPTSKWLSSILNDDKMVDAFRELFPDAQGRFTCWSQHTNRRYENDGIRIDYTIVDASMTEYFATCSPPKLRSCKYAKAEDDFGSEEAGMHAATASGLFQGASYQGMFLLYIYL